MSRLISPHSSFRRRTTGQAGFTLIEVLVTISILAILMTSVYGIFTSVSRARQQLDADSAEYHRARVVFDRLGREIRGAYFRTNSQTLVFAGGSQDDGTLEFELTTTAVTPLSQQGSGIARVHYLLQDDEEEAATGLVLMRREQPVHEPETTTEQNDMMRLVPGIEAMAMRFFADGQWQDRWDAKESGLPEMVEVTLDLRAGNDDTVRFLSAFDLPEVAP